uniref:Uncharacterized protein n=1 Tax=Anguilla anguilla TaxID=7936 RepID=A0A0E9TNX6_ANGAN
MDAFNSHFISACLLLEKAGANGSGLRERKVTPVQNRSLTQPNAMCGKGRLGFFFFPHPYSLLFY